MSPLSYSRMGAGSRQHLSYAGYSASRRSRQGGGGPFERNDPNSRMLDDNSPAKSAKYNIQKEREYERVKQRLEEEFKVLDMN